MTNIDYIENCIRSHQRLTAPELANILATEGIALEVRNVRKYLEKLESQGKVNSQFDTVPASHQKASPPRKFYYWIGKNEETADLQVSQCCNGGDR